MNKPSTRFLTLGAINGFLTVALGAFAAHALKNLLSPGLLQVFQTAVDYHGLHAIALVSVGLILRSYSHPALIIAGWAFASGILIFCGSLYLLALTDASLLGAATPFGGVAFLIGWGSLAWGITHSRNS